MADLSSKQRSYLMKLATAEDPIMQIGKSGLTPEICTAVSEALEARELVKVALLKNNFDDIRGVAEALGGRTRSQVVTVIGRKIVLYRPSKTKKRIELP